VLQEIGAFLLLAGAVAYLVYRRLRRRASGNCCGEPECPAAKRSLRRLRP
jgi:hypothetical protein